MPSATELTTEDRFMGLLVGPSGTGKTGFACSYNDQKTLVLDFDGRIRGILGCPWVNRANVDYESYPPKMSGLLEKIDKKLETLLINSQNGQLFYKNIVLDSLTSETYAMLVQAVMLTHSPGDKGKSKTGKYIGNVAMADPGDYGFEATNTYNILSCLRSIPGINVFVSAHVVQKFGKSDPDDPYSPSIVIGEKLSLRDKISENVQIYFDHIFQFNKYEKSDGSIQHTVKFRSDIARTAYADLPNGEVDISGKSGYEVMHDSMKREVTNV